MGWNRTNISGIDRCVSIITTIRTLHPSTQSLTGEYSPVDNYYVQEDLNFSQVFEWNLETMGEFVTEEPMLLIPHRSRSHRPNGSCFDTCLKTGWNRYGL